MSEDEIQCMDCSSNIKESKNRDSISYMTPLNKEEKLQEINKLIETKDLKDITSCICIDCLHVSLGIIKSKINEEEQKHDDYLISLKNLLLDISNKKDIYKIVDNLLGEKEIKELEENYKSLCKKREELEEKLKNDKDELKKLRDEEENIFVKLNENERKKEEEKKYIKKLNMKKEYLQKLYEQIIEEP